jgi:hypothetical protein
MIFGMTCKRVHGRRIGDDEEAAPRLRPPAIELVVQGALRLIKYEISNKRSTSHILVIRVVVKFCSGFVPGRFLFVVALCT